MNYLTKKEKICLAILLVISFVPAIGGMLRIFEIMGVLSIMPANPRAFQTSLPIALHIVGAVPFCVLGALQFLPSVRRKALKWHKFNGPIIAFSGVLSAVTGVWMAHFYSFPSELQGHALYSARIILGAAMIYLIIFGVHAIKRGNTSLHGARMMRAYAIGQGAGTQAFLGIAWMAVFSEEASGLTRDILMISAWIINLLIAEFFIRKTLTNVRYFKAA